MELDYIGWDPTASQALLVGKQEQGGFEFEAGSKIEDFSFVFSHAYIKLMDFDLKGGSTLITAEPFGFGDDLANWSNHISKSVVTYRVSDRLQFNSSLRYYWDFPGSKDYRDYYVSTGTDRVDSDWEKGYDRQVFLNFGG